MDTQSKLELHYYLEGGVHSMDAFAKNSAEAELLKIFHEVSVQLDLDLSFELEALEQGGIKEFIKVLSKKKSRRKMWLVLSFLGGMLATVVTNVASDYLTKDHELEDLQKEELKLHIQKLKRDLEEEPDEEKQIVIIQQISFYLMDTDKIKLHKAKFYTAVLQDPKVYQLSTTELDENNKPKGEEKVVLRSDFAKFIADKVTIEPEEIDDVVIEVVSPVLKAGKMKWKGIYDGKPVSFNMIDSDFKNSVLSGEVSFTSGMSIRCGIQFEKVMGDDGEVKITQINIYDVLEVIQGGSVTVTGRAKHIEADKKQVKMDFFKAEDDENATTGTGDQSSPR